MSIFTGSGVALITPFHDDGSIDLDTYGELIDFQIKNHTDAIITCGTTGEPSTMTFEERHQTVQYCIDHVAGKIPVIVGTGTNCTATTIRESLLAEECGADALLLITPYYNKCTQSGLINHFTAVADAVSLPIIIYNVPSRTGVNILPATMHTLAQHQNIVALKDATGNIEQIVETARLCPELDIYSGNDDHILPFLALGGKGVISVLANVVPQQTHDLVASFLNGNIEESRRLQFQLNPLVHALFCEVNPIPVKYAVSELGFSVGSLRLPLTSLEPDHQKLVQKEMDALGLLSSHG